MKTLEALIRFALEHYPTLRNHHQFMSMWDRIRTEREALDRLVLAAESAATDLDLIGSDSSPKANLAWKKLRDALAECRRAGVLG